MNSLFVNERSRAVAQRMRSSFEENARIESLYRTLFQRRPTDRQLEAGLQFIKDAAALPQPKPPKPAKPVWVYGFGEYDDAGRGVASFEPLPHFTGDSWQAVKSGLDENSVGCA
jgi:hypothetical protein